MIRAPLATLLPLALCVFALSACEEEAPPPSVSFLAPAQGATVDSGTVAVSLVIENLTLTAPEAARRAVARPSRVAAWLGAVLPGRAARAHGDEGAEGYCVLSLDGVEVATLATTQAEVDGVAAGAHTLRAELRYADGHPVEPEASAEVGFTAVDP